MRESSAQLRTIMRYRTDTQSGHAIVENALQPIEGYIAGIGVDGSRPAQHVLDLGLHLGLCSHLRFLALRLVFPPRVEVMMVVLARLLAFPLGLLTLEPVCHLSEYFLGRAIDPLRSTVKVMRALRLLVTLRCSVFWELREG